MLPLDGLWCAMNDYHMGTTAENIARHIFYQARNQKLNVSEVRVWETSTSCAAFSEN